MADKEIVDDKSLDGNGSEEPKDPNLEWLKLNGEEQSEENFTAFINKQVTDHPVVKNQHWKWKELIAWEEGQQFSLWDKEAMSMKPIEFSQRRAKVVVNLMKPLVETLDGKIVFDHSIVGVPNSGELKDMHGANVASKFIAFNDHVVDIETVLAELKYDLLLPGTACIKWIWDPNINGTIAPRVNGVHDSSKEAAESGDVNVKNVPIFNLRPDPTAKRPQDLRWVIEIIEINEDEMIRVYPKSKGLLEELSESQGKKYLGQNVDQKDRDPDEKTYIIKEFWERGNSYYPKGRKIVTCANRVIYGGKNPSPKAKLPYFWFFYNKKPYVFWSWGPTYYVQDLQRFVNRLVSMSVEHIESWKPKIMVGPNAIKTVGAFTNDIAEILEVDFSRGEPRPLVTPELSPQVGAMREFMIGAIDRVSNVHEVSYSRLPEGSSRTPASLYSQMMDQENTKLDQLIVKSNKTIKEMDTFRLELMDQHYKLSRKVKIVGKNRASSIAYYDSADLNKNFDIQLENGVSMAQSQTIQTRLLIELFSQGILDDSDKPRIKKAIEFSLGEKMMNDDLADMQKALRENQSFIDGTWDRDWNNGGVMFFIHDDHPLHMDYHTNLIKTEEATKWPEKDILGLAEHINQHFQVMAMVQEAAAQNASPAGVPGPGAVQPDMSGDPSVDAAAAGAPGPVPEPPGGAVMEPGSGMQSQQV